MLTLMPPYRWSQQYLLASRRSPLPARQATISAQERFPPRSSTIAADCAAASHLASAPSCLISAKARAFQLSERLCPGDRNFEASGSFLLRCRPRRRLISSLSRL